MNITNQFEVEYSKRFGQFVFALLKTKSSLSPITSSQGKEVYINLGSLIEHPFSEVVHAVRLPLPSNSEKPLTWLEGGKTLYLGTLKQGACTVLVIAK